jgi:hypothetical protein
LQKGKQGLLEQAPGTTLDGLAAGQPLPHDLQGRSARVDVEGGMGLLMQGIQGTESNALGARAGGVSGPGGLGSSVATFPCITYGLFSQLGTSSRHTKPIAHAFLPAVQPNVFLAHRRGSTISSRCSYPTRSRTAELKMLCIMERVP